MMLRRPSSKRSVTSVTRASQPTLRALPNGKALLIGPSSAEVFDPAVNAWHSIGDPAASGWDPSPVLPDGRVAVFGVVVAAIAATSRRRFEIRRCERSLTRSTSVQRAIRCAYSSRGG